MAENPQLVCEPVTETGKKAPKPPPPPPADIFSSAHIPTPTERPLMVYATDPSAGRFVGNHMTATVRYETLEPGPIGERFAVIDYDGANNTFYKPVDLNDPRLLVGGGFPPMESDPRFHQQMV